MIGGDPSSHTPAPESAVTVAPFQAWRSSQHIAAGGPGWVTIERRIVAESGGDSYSGRLCSEARKSLRRVSDRSLRVGRRVAARLEEGSGNLCGY